MKEITLKAENTNLPVVTDFVEEYLENFDISMKSKIQLDVAIDEIFSNIANYAYKDSEEAGDVTVSIEVPQNSDYVIMIFKDNGNEFNPLESEDPDTTLSAEERQIGGLGIFMVKKTMDDVIYRYENGTNILTIKKNFNN